MLCRSEMCCTRLAGNTGRKKSPFWHHCTTLSGHIFATKACIDNRKNLLIWWTSANNGWDRLAGLGHPIIFQRVSSPDSVTARHLVVGVSQTLRCWTEGATYVHQGDHHVGHWPTFLVLFVFPVVSERQWVVKFKNAGSRCQPAENFALLDKIRNFCKTQFSP